MILRIGNVQIAGSIDRHAIRRDRRCGRGPAVAGRSRCTRARDSHDDPRCGNSPDSSVAYVRNEQITLLVHGQTAWIKTSKTKRRLSSGPSIARKATIAIASNRTDAAIKSDLTDPVVAGIHNKEVAASVNGHRIGIGKKRLG